MEIFIKTYGCSNNFFESQVMAGLLKKEGYKIVSSDKKAKLIIVNMCTVKNPTETKILRFLKKHAKKKLIIAGCITKEIIPELRNISKTASLMNTHNIDKIIEVVEKTLKGQKVRYLSTRRVVKVKLPKLETKGIVSIVPICSGCNGKCSYCSVRFVKGELFSYPPKIIIEQVKNSLEKGAKEIWITSQDNAAYEFDLVLLLKKILDLDYDFKLRLGMMNPNNVLGILKPLVAVFKHKKMFKFLHIPLQSGNDIVLKKMNRQYSVKDFFKIIKLFKKEIPGITIATDLICGFPTEAVEQFNDTLEVVKKIKPKVLNISRYWPRAGTPALKLKPQIHGKETKKRSQELTKLFRKLAVVENKKLIGKTFEILIDEKGKNNSMIGRTKNYNLVVVSSKHKIGDKVKVRIKQATEHYLKGAVTTKAKL